MLSQEDILAKLKITLLVALLTQDLFHAISATR